MNKPTLPAAAIQSIYANRWTPDELTDMKLVWGIITREFFQRFIDHNGTLLDLGAGFCGFINAARAKEKIAFDRNPGLRQFADPDVRVIISDRLDLQDISDASISQVFMSNFLEHLSDSAAVLSLLRALRAKLKPGGSLLILQPNFRYVGAAYFDFIDHHVVLTEKSLAEALESCGYRITYMKKRFLPYTSKSRIPKFPFLVWLYVKLPVLHWLFGQQTFVIAELDAR